MVKKASKRLWVLRRLKFLGASYSDLIEVYTKQIRCVLELAVPAWQGSMSLVEKQDLERIQKCATHIILGETYTTYQNALIALDQRRNTLALKFALKSEKHDKFKAWFKPASKSVITRSKPLKYCEIKANHSRFFKSPLGFLTRMLNTYYQKG